MCPMVSRKVIKSQEFFSIFLKALGGFGIFEFIGFNEEIKCLLCIFSGFCHPDVMDILFCFGLTVFGELVEDVCCLENPATLATGLAKDFSYCLPAT